MDLKPTCLSISNHATIAIKQLLANHVLGTPGKGMLYKQGNINDKITHIPQPCFVSIGSKTSLIGTSCFCKRICLNNGIPAQSFYIRYFSFKPGYRTSKGNDKPNFGKSNKIKDELNHLLSENGLAQNKKTLFYAYVDPSNERSVNLCNQFGFKPIRTFTTLLYSRFSPKPHPLVQNIKPEE